MSAQPATLQDILSALSELTTEVRRLSRDVSALHFLVEGRLGPLPAPVPRACPALPQPASASAAAQAPAFSSPSAPSGPGSCCTPVPRASLSSAPVPRAFLSGAPVPRASSAASSFSVVPSQPASSSAPVPRAPAHSCSPPASVRSEPLFLSPAAVSAAGSGLDLPGSPTSCGLVVEPPSTPPRLPPSAQISEEARREVAVSIGAFSAGPWPASTEAARDGTAVLCSLTATLSVGTPKGRPSTLLWCSTGSAPPSALSSPAAIWATLSFVASQHCGKLASLA